MSKHRDEAEAELDPVEALVHHLKECRDVSAAVVADGDATDLVTELVAAGWTYEGVEYVGDKRVRYLVPPPGVVFGETTAAWPTEVDTLPSSPEDPEGYHVREKTESGYPLMGSSPAEREEARQRSERIQRQAMRDHPFVGEGAYCEARITTRPQGSPELGILTGWVGCGYGRDTHPEPEPGETFTFNGPTTMA